MMASPNIDTARDDRHLHRPGATTAAGRQSRLCWQRHPGAVSGLIAYSCYSRLHFPLVQAMQMMAAGVVVAIVGIVFGFRDARKPRQAVAL